MRWKIIVPIAVVVVVVVVVAVLTLGDSKSDKAMAKVCDARSDIAAQLKTLQNLSPGSARSQARESLQAIAGDVKQIADARVDLAKAHRDQVQSANQQFRASVKDIAGSVTNLASLQAAGGQVKQEAQQLAQAYKTSYGKIDCS
jgi:valyl-tRNA synthetase